MSWKGLDQRVFPRAQARCNISIDYPIGGTIEARTHNLGAGGACVILQKEIAKLSKVKIKLMLEDSIPSIQCEGRIIWMVRSTEPVSRKTTFDTGIEFLDLKDEDQERILAFTKTNTSFSKP